MKKLFILFLDKIYIITYNLYRKRDGFAPPQAKAWGFRKTRLL